MKSLGKKRAVCIHLLALADSGCGFHLPSLAQIYAARSLPLSAASTRRGFVESVSGLTLGLGMLGCPLPPAFARGLINFPPREPLSNRFFFVRAGESMAEAADIVCTNPVSKLAVENGLTEKGVQQAEEAAAALAAFGVDCPTIYYSTWAKSSQTASIIGEKLDVGYDRKLPEFTFLDSRGMGGFDGTSLAEAEAAVALIDARDFREAPPGTEEGETLGNGGESLANLLVRGYQMISGAETQAGAGEDIVLVGADSDLLSCWQAAIAGAPLSGHRAFAMEPGEVRPLEYRVQFPMNNGSPPPLVLVDYDYSHAGGLQPLAAGSTTTSNGNGGSGDKGGGRDGSSSSSSSKRGSRSSINSKTSNSLVSYSEASERGREALLDARMAKAKELAAASEARLASMGPEGVASERAALRAKLAEQQRAAEEATTEAYNQERASEAQDAATQQEADRGRQRAAAVQRRKESDAAAVAAAELAGQQQPGITSFAPFAAAKFLVDYPVAGLLGAGFAASVVSQSRNARRNSYSPIDAVTSASNSSGSSTRALRDPPPSETDEVDTRFASAVDAIAAVDRAERRTQALPADRMVAQLERAMARSDAAAAAAAGAGGGDSDRDSVAASTGRPTGYCVPSREPPSVAAPWANRQVAAKSAAAIAEAEKEAAAVAAAAALSDPTHVAPSVETPQASRFASTNANEALSNDKDVPASSGPSVTSFEVTFLRNSLGVSIAEPLADDSLVLPMVAAVDVDVATVRVGEEGSERPSSSTAAAEFLPKVGDRLASVNGINLLKDGDSSSTTSAQVYDSALDKIAGASRPLVLGFVRQNELLGSDQGKRTAAEAEAAAAAEAFFEAVGSADASGDDDILNGEGPREL